MFRHYTLETTTMMMEMAENWKGCEDADDDDDDVDVLSCWLVGWLECGGGCAAAVAVAAGGVVRSTYNLSLHVYTLIAWLFVYLVALGSFWHLYGKGEKQKNKK